MCTKIAGRLKTQAAYILVLPTGAIRYYSNGNDYWLRSSDYIRLKNLEIGYTLPSTLVSKIGMSQFRVYFNGLNLFTIDKLKVFDPEADNSTGYYYPQQKIINFGLAATF